MATAHTESESAWEYSGSGPRSSENQPELVEQEHDTAQDSDMSDQDQSTHEPIASGSSETVAMPTQETNRHHRRDNRTSQLAYRINTN